MLHSGDAAFQFMRMTNIIMRLYKRGADPIHPRAPHGLSQKTRWDAFPSPRRPLPAPVGATRAAETSLLCNFASVLSRLSGPSRGPFPFSVELEILSLVFSFLFHSVWGAWFAPTAVSSPDGRLHFTGVQCLYLIVRLVTLVV